MAGRVSWLPHGIAGKDDDDAALCPIWLSGETQDNPIAAEFVFYLDGMTPQNAGGFDRIFIFFNGLDDTAYGHHSTHPVEIFTRRRSRPQLLDAG